MTKHTLLPLAAMLFALPAFAASASDVHLSTTALSFNGSSGQASTGMVIMSPSGSTPFTVSKVSISNTDFTGSVAALPKTISKGQSFTIRVTAQPQSSAQNGTLTISTTAGTFAIKLSETAASQQTSHSVGLNWHAPTTNPDAVDSYKVQRALSGSGSWSTIASPGASTTTWTDRAVVSKKSYVYEVQAVDDQGKVSPNSNQVTVTIP